MDDNMTGVIIILAFLIMWFCTAGSPDILDGLIKRANNIECTKEIR